MSDFAATDRLFKVTLNEPRPRARTPAIQQELDVAIYDLTGIEPLSPPIARGHDPAGPYQLDIGMADRMLVMQITNQGGESAGELHLSISPLRRIIKDYFAICESYFDAVKRLPPSKIEAIDMGRRGLHNEGASILMERLDGRIATDDETARRLFTVICALQFRG